MSVSVNTPKVLGADGQDLGHSNQETGFLVSPTPAYRYDFGMCSLEHPRTVTCPVAVGQCGKRGYKGRSNGCSCGRRARNVVWSVGP